jgi:hypothetical protein
MTTCAPVARRGSRGVFGESWSRHFGKAKIVANGLIQATKCHPNDLHLDKCIIRVFWMAC